MKLNKPRAYKFLLAMVGGSLLTVCAAWDPGEPVTTYWAGSGFPGAERLSDRWLAQLKEGGFNTVWAMTPAELDLAAKYGMRAIYKPKELCDRKISLNIDDPAAASAMEAMVNRVKNHPALYVYELYDEPAAGLFALLRLTR